jgi:hypothetical protein
MPGEDLHLFYTCALAGAPAWGVSPRNSIPQRFQALKGRQQTLAIRSSAALSGLEGSWWIPYLGLTPQALFCRLFEAGLRASGTVIL